MSANINYNQPEIDEYIVQTSPFESGKQIYITFHKLLLLPTIDSNASIMGKVNILPPSNQNLQFSSLHVPKTALESL